MVDSEVILKGEIKLQDLYFFGLIFVLLHPVQQRHRSHDFFFPIAQFLLFKRCRKQLELFLIANEI